MHTYRNNGQYHATLVVTDSHDASDTAATTIPVANAPPVITGLTTPSVVVLGSSVSIQVSFSDPGVDDTLTASVNWADQSSSPIAPGTATHTYTSLGSYVVTVTVRDQDGGVAVKRAATAISVSSNRAPHAHINGGVTGTQEGTKVFYDATGSNDPDGDSLTYQWQFSDGSADVKGFVVEHTFIDQGKYVITLIVTDSHGATDRAHWGVEIWNAAPAIRSAVLTIPRMPAPVPVQAKLRLDVFDQGPADNPVATIDWGDGTVSRDTVHTYPKPGVYSVTVTATDKDGAVSGPWTSVPLWVYDPTQNHPTAPGYEAIELGTLGGNAVPSSLNNHAEVVGWSATSDSQQWVYHGFLWKAGVLTDLGPPGSTRGHADVINDAGWIAGASGRGSDPYMVLWQDGIPAASDYVASDEFGVGAVRLLESKDALANVEGHEYPRAYVVRNGSATYLGDLGGYHSWGSDMNSREQIVGSAAIKYVGAAAYEWHAFLWEGGVIKDLGNLGTTPCSNIPELQCGYSEASDINEQGQIVGWAENSAGVMRAVIWESNTTTPKDLGFGSGSTRAVAINEHGQIAGDTYSPGEGYFLDGTGIVRLGSLGGGHTQVVAMNEDGVVIGTSVTSGGEVHAFVWSRRAGMRDLGTGPFGVPGIGAVPVAINAHGDVIGYAMPCMTHSGVSSCSYWSTTRAILWRHN